MFLKKNNDNVISIWEIIQMINRLLILGASGMLGSTLLRYFSDKSAFQVFATIRNSGVSFNVGNNQKYLLYKNIDAKNHDDLRRVFNEVQPDVVVNCIGIVKQLPEGNNPLVSIPLNSLLPHILAQLCTLTNSRLIHISTDCVFSGDKGGYIESDIPDAVDLYGRSKLLGELNYPHTITLRTSIIGHELTGRHGLINWFLSQSASVNGFRKAVFSGLPTVEIARVLESFILPFPSLHGLYHLSADPISKYDLLSIVKNLYKKKINIKPDDSVVIDRSLDSNRLRKATGFFPKPWPKLIKEMNEFG